MNKTILVVEDDEEIRNYLKEILIQKGYMAKAVGDGVAAVNEIKKRRADLVILDLGLPNLAGESVCAEIKKMYPEIPIIILTARGTSMDMIKGFNLGADDYVAKPFEVEVLLARIKARLRNQNGEDAKIKVADLSIDLNTLEVKRGSKKIHLTPQEIKILEYLMHNKGRVLTRDMILNRIWLYSSEVETRVVDVYIGYLRKKIDSGFKKKLIHSIRGFGYTIKE